MLKHVLYGDGIHDDLPAIQEMLDNRSYVYLPPPEKNYLIGKAIRLSSGQELRLDRFSRIMLIEHSNTCMLKNRNAGTRDKNIKVSGGIWDMNHRFQRPNPAHFSDKKKGELSPGEWSRARADSDPYCKEPLPIYSGFCMMFFNVAGLTVSDITIENPVTYGIDVAFTENFTVENIHFDYFEGSPKLWNMDGIHIEGGCKNGYIHNLSGTCHDDTVALTTEDLYRGDIENITVDGIYGRDSHSAVRLLSRANKLKNVHITNIYGTYYVAGIIISKYSQEEKYRSAISNITIDNVYASFCMGTKDVTWTEDGLISFGSGIDVQNAVIEKLFRDEECKNPPAINIGDGSIIGSLSISDCRQMNFTGEPMEFIRNNGKIKKLYLKNIEQDEELLSGEGTVEALYSCDAAYPD